MRMATPSPVGQHRSTSRITGNRTWRYGAQRGAAGMAAPSPQLDKLHAEQIAQYFRRYFTSITTTGNVTAASNVPSATAPDTGFTNR